VPAKSTSVTFLTPAFLRTIPHWFTSPHFPVCWAAPLTLPLCHTRALTVRRDNVALVNSRPSSASHFKSDRRLSLPCLHQRPYYRRAGTRLRSIRYLPPSVMLESWGPEQTSGPSAPFPLFIDTDSCIGPYLGNNRVGGNIGREGMRAGL